MNQRTSGILLHISSLPTEFGIGDLGPAAYQFVDFLQLSGQSYWQILPITPTNLAHKNSPYSSPSAFAGNNIFISPELLCNENLLKSKDLLPTGPQPKEGIADYEYATIYKTKLLKLAFQNFKNKKKLFSNYTNFIKEHAFWLEDYARFVVLKKQCSDKPWDVWPTALCKKNLKALNDFYQKFKTQIEQVKFEQFIFFKQWHDLKNYANQKNIQLIGDIPIYVTYDSVDVWSQPENFKLNSQLKLDVVAGVPPDYFSETGQRWGNPVYDWQNLKQTNYQWWIERIKVNLELFDLVRIDHFRGLVNYWEIPVEEKTAINGYWVDVPTDDFFKCIQKTLLKPKSDPGGLIGKIQLPIIAEDLGIITDEVRDAMKRQGFPGMKILLFAFGDNEHNPYLPHNYTKNCVVYTGTHDNNTVQGWYHNDATDQEKINLKNYLKKDIDGKNIHWELIDLAMKSTAQLAIIPLQDVLGLDKKARMNTPATIKNNWQWKFKQELLTKPLAQKLLKLTRKSHRNMETNIKT